MNKTFLLRRLRHGLLRLGHAALDALLPPRCLACATPVLAEGTLCAACFREVRLIGPPLCLCCGIPFLHAGQGEPALGGGLICPRCAETPPVYARARAAYLYDAGAKRLLLPFKYAGRTELALPLARQMAHAGRELLAEADLLLPVPLHRRRLLSRGYNQAGLLAARLSRLGGVPWAPDLLRRARATTALARHGAAERAALLEGAFRLAPGGAARVAGRRLLLVDDVLTSGATASACAAVLMAAGAARVEVLAAARVPDPRLAEKDMAGLALPGDA